MVGLQVVVEGRLEEVKFLCYTAVANSKVKVVSYRTVNSKIDRGCHLWSGSELQLELLGL